MPSRKEDETCGLSTADDASSPSQTLFLVRIRDTESHLLCMVVRVTITGGSRRAEKSRKVLIMTKAAKLGWAGPGAGQEQTMSRPGAGWSKLGAGQEQCKSREEARVGQEH